MNVALVPSFFDCQTCSSAASYARNNGPAPGYIEVGLALTDPTTMNPYRFTRIEWSTLSKLLPIMRRWNVETIPKPTLLSHCGTVSTMQSVNRFDVGYLLAERAQTNQIAAIEDAVTTSIRFHLILPWRGGTSIC